VILFRREHSRRVLVPRDFISAPGLSEADVYRRGGPAALVTGRCVFRFDRERRRFQLASIHDGDTPNSISEPTAFDFDQPPAVPVTKAVSDDDRGLLRSRVLEELAETYPRFAGAYREGLDGGDTGG